jgi:hypothetical protein
MKTIVFWGIVVLGLILIAWGNASGAPRGEGGHVKEGLPAHVVIPGHHQAPSSSLGNYEPCPLDLEKFPEDTVCGEGGSYWMPD